MFFKNFHILFIFMLFSGSIISISSNSWFTAWLGLEINLMSMVPLILNKLNSSLSEASIKYFLSQAMASVIMIFSISLIFMAQENFLLMSSEFLLSMALGLKTGLAPLHFWFPQVISNLSWIQALILFSWQKVAPLILLCSLKNLFLVVLIILSSLTGALGGLNQISMKMILTYSSISHSAWMLSACILNFNTWMNYFLIYCLISFSIILFFYTNSLEKISEVFSSNDSNTNKNILMMNLLSLGGLPPLLGFAAKINIVVILIKFNLIIVLLPLILSSLLSLYFYSRIIYSSLFYSPSSHYLNFSANKNNNLFLIVSISFNILFTAMILA